MGQQEVSVFLRKYRDEWFIARQIAEKTNASFGSVVVNLKRLRQSKQVLYKKIKSNSLPYRKVFIYKFKEWNNSLLQFLQISYLLSYAHNFPLLKIRNVDFGSRILWINAGNLIGSYADSGLFLSLSTMKLQD